MDGSTETTNSQSAKESAMPPDHSESIGYLRGRLDGHEGRLTSVEQGLKDGLANVWDRLSSLDSKLDTLLMRSAHDDGQQAAKNEMTTAQKASFGFAITIIAGLIGSAMQAQWHIFP